MNFKIGFGYDVHRLEQGYKLIIGGIEVPYDKGSVGHSDADVLIHAIMDALFGAAGMRDIGFHFPDTDASYKGIDSKILLKKCHKLIREAGFEIGNIDATVSLQQPKIGSLIPKMQETISSVLDLPVSDVSIKATTTEKLGFVGTGAGLAAQAVALIYRRNV
jgi:2-C-methyl-D-erythritol 2,4-cyclodiphosphate synthase